jgi:hypothetical protein
MTTKTPTRDGRQNKVNWNFGELLLRVKEQASIPTSLIRFFQSIALSIEDKHGWFHPQGFEEWKSIANSVVASQVRRLEDMDSEQILMQRRGTRFAYIYRAIRNRMIDEIRRLSRRPKEGTVDELSFPTLADPSPHPAVRLQREDTKVLLSAARQQFAKNNALPAVLSEIEFFLENDEGSNVRPRIVANLAHRLDVSPQHARRMIIRFKKQSGTEESLRAIRAALRGTQSLLDQQWPLYPKRRDDQDEWEETFANY